MRDKLLTFLSPRLRPGDRVVAAVSGGKDSMAMLHCLLSLREALGFTLSAAHFHHGIRGQEADRDAAFVEEICREWQVPLTLGHGDVPGQAALLGRGLEDTARLLRYRFLQGIDPGAWVLTAHTAEDSLETLLMRLIRGTGLHGLTGIPPQRDRILRPMLEVTRPELEDYLTVHQIPHVEDSTNGSRDYLRNRLRQQVLPALLAENPNAALSAVRLTKTLRAEDEYLDTLARQALQGLLSSEGLSRPGLLAQPEALRYRILMAYLEAVPSLGRVHLEGALGLCRSESPSAAMDLPGFWRLERQYDVLVLRRGEEPAPVPTPLVLDGTTPFGPWQVACVRGPMPEMPPPGALALDPRFLAGGLTLRPRRRGDTIVLSGGTRLVSRLMIDHKVPAPRRDSLPLVCQGETVLAVLPLRSAHPRPEPGQDSLLLSITRTEV